MPRSPDCHPGTCFRDKTHHAHKQTIWRRQAAGETVEAIQPDLVILTGKRRGQSPSVASIYRALAAHAKAKSYPDAIDQARTEFAVLPADSR